MKGLFGGSLKAILLSTPVVAVSENFSSTLRPFDIVERISRNFAFGIYFKFFHSKLASNCLKLNKVKRFTGASEGAKKFHFSSNEKCFEKPLILRLFVTKTLKIPHHQQYASVLDRFLVRMASVRITRHKWSICIKLSF